MNAARKGRRERIDEPTEFPAPPPEVMAELRRLLPPVEPSKAIAREREAGDDERPPTE